MPRYPHQHPHRHSYDADGGTPLETAADALVTACRLMSVEHQRLARAATATRAKGQAATGRRMSLAVEKAGAQLEAAVAELTTEARRPSGGGRAGLHTGAALLHAAVWELTTAYNCGAVRGGRRGSRRSPGEANLYMLGVTSVLRTAARSLAAELYLTGAVASARGIGGLDQPLDLLRDRFAPPSAPTLG